MVFPIALPPIISTSSDLSQTCERLAKHEFITIDTEFIRETTYYPKLCLVQLASLDEVVLVDPLAENIDLAPLFSLLISPNVVKVFHSARQDIEIFWNIGKIIPSPLFDSQVAAMVCGYGEQISYENLAASLAGVKIDKSSRYTDWSHRPLSEAQIRYAAADVTHLCIIYQKLKEIMIKKNREHWVAEEMALLANPATYQVIPEEAWTKIKTRSKNPKEIAVLMALAAWRELKAQNLDVPRNRVLKEEIIVSLASTRPQTIEELGKSRGLPSGFSNSKDAKEIIEIIKNCRCDDLTLSSPHKEDRRDRNGALLQLLKILLQSIAEKEQVAARLIATSDDLESLAADHDADILLLQGWRKDIFGDLSLRFLKGEILLGVERGKIIAINK